jgi:hypothetical protein
MMVTSQDLLGPRFEWSLSGTAGEVGDTETSVALYAGEWTFNRQTMCDNCCWRDESPKPITVKDALDFAPICPVDEVVSAHLHWARLIGGRKGAGMSRSLTIQLAKRGLVIAAPQQEGTTS